MLHCTVWIECPFADIYTAIQSLNQFQSHQNNCFCSVKIHMRYSLMHELIDFSVKFNLFYVCRYSITSCSWFDWVGPLHWLHERDDCYQFHWDCNQSIFFCSLQYVICAVFDAETLTEIHITHEQTIRCHSKLIEIPQPDM